MIKEADYGSHKVTTKIDSWGRKVNLNDPSAGSYDYTYTILGELLEEKSPKGKTTIEYDGFGRISSKTIKGDETDLSLAYDYDQGSTELLEGISGQDAINNRSYDYIYEYDHENHERLKSVKEINDLAQFEKHFKYDGLGRVETEKYISRNISNGVQTSLETRNVYDPSSGLLRAIFDNTNGSGVRMWGLDQINARGQVLKSTLGNGITKNREYDPYGFAKKIQDKKSGTTGTIALNLSYIFDHQRGNLKSRNNIKLNWSEGFDYDPLDRLTEITGNVTKTTDYDNFGRITKATDVGDYGYQSGNRYRLEEIDPNKQGDAYYSEHSSQQITYNAYKKPVDIHEQGHGRASFEYGPMMTRSHAFYGGEQSNKLERRYHKHYSSIIPAEIVEDREQNTTKIVIYIGGDAYTAPIVHIKKNGSNSIDGYHYLHRDYLGSILAITDPNGNVKEERQFGAWGKVDRFLKDGSPATFSHGSLLGRGYTGHEHFFEVGLIHMNGRMYDPKLGRFLSPDNYIQEPFNTQNFNRYGYVLNNPLKYTDPSGEQSVGGDGGLSSGQQVGIAALIASAASLLEGKQIGRWLETNAKSAIDDYVRPYREVGRFFRRLFGGKKESFQPVRFSNAINSDVAVQSNPTIPSVFTSSGNSSAGNGCCGWSDATEISRLQAQASLMGLQLDNDNLSGFDRRRLSLNRGAMLGMASDLRVKEYVAPTDALSISLNALSVIPGGGILRYSRLASIAAKSSTKGGLSLFKWGASQTGRNVGWKIGDYMLHLPNKGTPRLNWKANYGALRREMGLGKPIFDSYRTTGGSLIPTGGFLNAERSILRGRGWIYNPSNGAWMPPRF